MADKNYEYFISNFDALYKKYKDKFVVIKNSTIIGSYNTFEDAYDASIKIEELGTFLIQHCSKTKDSIAFFSSNNVSFA